MDEVAISDSFCEFTFLSLILKFTKDKQLANNSVIRLFKVRTCRIINGG